MFNTYSGGRERFLSVLLFLSQCFAFIPVNEPTISSFFLQPLSSISCHLFPSFLLQLNTQLNQDVLGCLMYLLHLNFKSFIFADILVQHILFTWPTHCNCVFSNNVNKFWPPTPSLRIRYIC